MEKGNLKVSQSFSSILRAYDWENFYMSIGYPGQYFTEHWTRKRNQSPKTTVITYYWKMASAKPRAEEQKSLLSIIKECGLKPLTKKNVLFYYTPVLGAASYTFLSVNVMNPGLVVRFAPKRDVTNILLFSTFIGSGLYIYNRPHLNAAPWTLRIVYSTFGSVIFAFGSVLLWAVLRNALPQNMALCSLVGVSSGITLIGVGQNYLNFVDSQLEIGGSE